MQEPVDFIAFIIAILGMITSTQVAHLAGPYAAIMVLGATGAAISLSLHDAQMTTLQAVGYVSIRVVLAVVFTVSLAELLVMVADWAKPRYTIAPLALMIGYTRDFKKTFGFAEKRIKGLFNGKPDNP